MCINVHSYIPKRKKLTFLSMTDKYSENATRIRLHCTNVPGNYVTNILQEKGKVFSSLAGPVERSLFILVTNIWITASLSHQISHYIQMTIPADRDTPLYMYPHCDETTDRPISRETHRSGTTTSHTCSQERVTGGMPVKHKLDFSLFTELFTREHSCCEFRYDLQEYVTARILYMSHLNQIKIGTS